MKSILIDTQVFAWSLQGEGHLTWTARQAMGAAEKVYLCSISFYEIIQKVRLGKWDEMRPFAENLLAFAHLQRTEVLPLDGDIGVRAGTLMWSHRDPFDRLIAATAIQHALPLVSTDKAFDGIVSRIW